MARPSSQTTATYTYTNNGRVATIKNARDYLTTYEYDGFDRLVKIYGIRFRPRRVAARPVTMNYSLSTPMAELQQIADAVAIPSATNTTT